MQDIKKVAVVTGASRGIGAAIARHFAARGFAVLVNYKTRKDEADAVVAEIIDGEGNAAAFAADVSSDSGAKELIDFAISKRRVGCSSAPHHFPSKRRMGRALANHPLSFQQF